MRKFKFLSKKYAIEANIRQEPSGILSLNIFLENKYIKQPNMEPMKRIIGKDIGPNIEPIAPNKIKSPHPIPSFLENSLKIKLVSHKEQYPNTKP